MVLGWFFVIQSTFDNSFKVRAVWIQSSVPLSARIDYHICSPNMASYMTSAGHCNIVPAFADGANGFLRSALTS